MTYTKPFTDISAKDSGSAGGKGASLGEMTRAGIPVPPGFVVLASSFEYFVELAGLAKDIEATLKTVVHTDVSAVEVVSQKIQNLILTAELPADMIVEINEAYTKLGSEYVAVRSSATAEDGVDHAWAGQLESYLYVTRGELLEKIRRCFASLFTPRAIFYRFEKKLQGTHISVAVVVQKMVNSEVSGIAFSVHPVTEDRNQLIIEAGYGLGEAIVSGQITPDSYVVEKTPRKIVDTVVSVQEKALYQALGKVGSEWSSLDTQKTKAQKLNDVQILELSEIILNIENHYGFPCDIEWAYESGKFYIVQSRPITTLLK